MSIRGCAENALHPLSSTHSVSWSGALEVERSAQLTYQSVVAGPRLFAHSDTGPYAILGDNGFALLQIFVTGDNGAQISNPGGGAFVGLGARNNGTTLASVKQVPDDNGGPPTHAFSVAEHDYAYHLSESDFPISLPDLVAQAPTPPRRAHFSGSTLLRTQEGLGVVRLGDGRSEVQTFALETQATDAVINDERLYVATPAALRADTPPCPLP